MLSKKITGLSKVGGSIVAVMLAGATYVGAQSVPAVILSSTAAVSTSGTSNVGKVVQDTCGNLYELEGGGNLMEIPAGGGAAIYLANYGGQQADGLSGGIAIDSKNNLYVDQKWGGAVKEVPASGCVPNPSAAVSVASSSLGAVGNYWYDPGDIAVDEAGDIFVASNNCCNGNGIFEQTAAGKGVQVLGGNSLPQVESLAADAGGNLFFTVNGSGTVYEVAAASYGTSTPTAVISSGLQTALGLAFDATGNLYVGDSGTGTIYEVPFTTGSGSTATLQFGSMFPLAVGLPLGSPLTISHDRRSFFFGNNDANVYQQALGSANIGMVAAGSSASATLDVVFTADVTPSAFALYPPAGQFSVAAGSNACAAGTAYTAGQSCSETITFTPANAGAANAGFALTDANGASLATLYASATGTGPALTIDPGAVSAAGSGFKSPESVAIDAAGDTFYADAGNNTVLEFAPGSSTAVSIGSGLSKPAGVAVDGAGNVLIADTGNNRIVEVPMVNGSLSNARQLTLVAAKDSKGNATPVAGAVLNLPSGIAMDGAGDIFIADTGNNRIVAVPYNGSWDFSAATAVGSSLTGPLAVAADSKGNLYVADSGAGQIDEILTPLTQPMQQLVGVGFGNPTGLALDASGSLFVADHANGDVERIPNISGSLDANSAVEAGIGINAPYGVAIDPSGNLYVSDSTAGAAYVVNRTVTGLSFGDWALNSTSGMLAAQIENEGNTSLTLGTPFYSASGNTGDFSISTSDSGICADGATVAAGSSCMLDATFTPTAPGARTETLALASNAVNGAAQVTLSGNGSTTAATTTTLAITSPSSGTPFFGQPITLTATVAAASGTPSGNATLLIDGAQTGVAPLNSSGVATFQLASGLTGGNHSLIAMYNGTSAFNGSVSAVLSLAVTKAPTVTKLSVAPPYADPLSAVSGNTVNITAVISSTGIGIPTGTVTFTSNGATIGTAPVLPATGGVFEANFSTTTLAAGADAIIATYPGDPNYIGSASGATTVTIVASPQLNVSPSGASVTTSTNSNGTVTFTATSYGGWSGMVGFGCLASSLPANARCVFSPGQVEVVPSTPSASASTPPVTLSVTVNQPPQTPTASSLLWWLAIPTGLLLFFARRRCASQAWAKATMVIAALLLGVSAIAMGACSSGVQFATPKGTSTVTVYAWSDPFQAGSTSNTMACGVNPSTHLADPSSAPCAQSSFQVSVTVQ